MLVDTCSDAEAGCRHCPESRERPLWQRQRQRQNSTVVHQFLRTTNKRARCFCLCLCVCSFLSNRPKEQVKLVLRVKGYENGFISNPAVMSPTCTVSDLDDLKAERNISGTKRNNLSPVPSATSPIDRCTRLSHSDSTRACSWLKDFSAAICIYARRLSLSLSLSLCICACTPPCEIVVPRGCRTPCACLSRLS